MRILLFFKISIMVLFLVGVVFVIRNVTSESVANFFVAFGIEPGTAQSPGLQPATRALKAGEVRFNICPTRIHAVVWPDGRKVEEKKEGLKLRWMAFDPSEREMAYLETEKWLSRHCQIIIEPKQVPENESLKDQGTFIRLEFIDGRIWEFGKAALPGPSGAPVLTLIGQGAFASPDFEDALRELEAIAGFKTSN